MAEAASFESFSRVLRRHAESRPDHPFLLSEARRLTYAEADRAVDRLAAGFAAQGLSAGDRVAAMLPSDFDYLLLWLACARSGLVLAAVNESLVGRMLAHQLDLADAAAIVVGPEQLEVVQRDVAGASRPPGLVLHGEPTVTTDDDWKWSCAFADLPRDEPAPEPPIARRDPMAIYFTSGTTGPSKGVLYGHGQAVATARPMADALAPEEVFYFCYPLFHVSVPHMLGAVLLRGGTIALRSRFSTSAFWPDVRRYGASVTMLLGAVAGFVEGAPPSSEDREHTLKRVFMVPLLRDLTGFQDRFGVEVMTWFNMTETSTPLHSHGFRRLEGQSCGWPRQGIEARIVDENDDEVPIGTVGELILRANDPWEFNLGYWRNPEKTVEAWQNLWFHTGDAFRRDAEGCFYFVDRLKDSIRRRGENISSFEIEAEVVEHPDIVECAAVAVPADDIEDEVKLVATLSPGRTLEPEALIAFLQPRLARHMLPRYIEITHEELPKTPTGKVKKAVLREAGTAGTWDREKERV